MAGRAEPRRQNHDRGGGAKLGRRGFEQRAGRATTPGNTAPKFPNTNDYVVVPVAKNPDGSPVTGLVMGRIVNVSGPDSQPMFVQTNPMPYKPMSLDTTQATLTTHASESIDGVIGGTATISEQRLGLGQVQRRQPVSGHARPDPDLREERLRSQAALSGGLQGAGSLRARDRLRRVPRHGVLLQEREARTTSGTPNPLAGRVSWVISRGGSQSGNFVRALLQLGFTQDEDNRKVYDGAWPIIAGRRISLNSRFAMPDGTLKLYEPGSEGPQWWADWPDSVRGLPAKGILDRCSANNTCPKIIEHVGAAEVWGLKLSPEWVGTSADADIPLPTNVRRYYIPSTQHGGGGGGFTVNPAAPPQCPSVNYGQGMFPANPVPHTQTVNAIRVHFRNWVMKDIPPPPSRWPTLKDHNLVDPTKEAMGFPTIPGLPPTAPTGLINPLLDYDWGPEFDRTDASGVKTKIPPAIKHVIKMKVPRVDADGNELGGVPVVLRDAPLGTYLGWNITAAGLPQGQDLQLCRRHDPVCQDQGRAHGQRRSRACRWRSATRLTRDMCRP